MCFAFAVGKESVRREEIGVLRMVGNVKTHRLCVIFGVCGETWGNISPLFIFRFSLDNVVGLNNIVKRHIKMTL